MNTAQKKTQADIEDIEKLFFDVVPERKNEFRNLVVNNKIEFWFNSVDIDLRFFAKENQIHICDYSLDVVWILGFTAWKLFTYHHIDFISNLRGRQNTTLQCSQNDYQRYLDNQVIRDLQCTVKQILDSNSRSKITWPDSVPFPQADRNGFSIEQQATFDIIMIAASFILLHEVKHVKFNNQNNARPQGPDEEIACDTFAKEFLLDKIGDFVVSRSESHQEVLTKRAMGIVLGAFVIYTFTPQEGYSGNNDYPHICDRLENLILIEDIDSDNILWIWAGTLLLGMLYPSTPNFDNLPDTPKDLCRCLIDGLRGFISSKFSNTTLPA